MIEKSTFDRIIPTANRGIAIYRRLNGCACFKFTASAIVNRAARKAVSPEVIGRIITPRIARRPPNLPNKAVQLSYTTFDGPPFELESTSA